VKNREKTIKISSLEGGCKKTFNEGEKEQRKTSQREWKQKQGWGEKGLHKTNSRKEMK